MQVKSNVTNDFSSSLLQIVNEKHWNDKKYDIRCGQGTIGCLSKKSEF
jgi:hypothetical protein